MTQFFEDVEIGDDALLGSHLFEAEAIIAFARKYDPQPFHVDPIAASSSLFGGLSASGWHTCAVWMRLIVDYRRRITEQQIAGGAALAKIGPSPGVKSLKWPRPVLAGDTVTYRTRLAGKVDLKSRPEWGLWLSTNEGHNQRGELVLSFTGQALAERRHPFTAPA